MVKKLLNGMVFGTGACMIVGVFMLGVWFVKGSDPLTATTGETLTAEKWNALVTEVESKKGLENSQIISCLYSSSNAGTAGWKNRIWENADCGGIIPNSFTNCMITNRQTDGAGIQRGLHACEKASGKIYLDTANSGIALKCEYLCRN
ncbi:MAG: hypothetical protein V3575_03845 [Candidatus Absconditabacteria bacterium]